MIKVSDVIKAVFLLSLTTLVILNTLVLAYLVPIVGYHLMPENQTAAEFWRVTGLIMETDTLIIIWSGIGYLFMRLLIKMTEIKKLKK
ncbi:MAG: hypothetical protein DRP18_05225 [Candidatus Aenigmatarchaeota archaeon]|nr:MAG: hypothetical protein DRP18_05225 [Candidatus Aenigmarchaeota archaeon]